MVDPIVERIKIPLTESAYRALTELARRELRPVPMQAAHMVLEALRHEQLLPAIDRPAEREPEAVRA